MNFGQAIEALNEGKRVKRSGWNGQNFYLQKYTPSGHDFFTAPFIFLEYPASGSGSENKAYPAGHRVPWLASHSDMFASDWFDYDEVRTR